MDIITVEDLASYLRDATVTGAGADLVVELANDLVSEALGNPTDESTITAQQRAIVFEVAARAWRNPEGYSSETIDDYTYRRDADTRQAGVYLTSAERDALTNATSRAVMRWLA